MRDLAWIIKSNTEAVAREAAHRVNSGNLEGARQSDAFRQYERNVVDGFVSPVFDAAYQAARLEG